MKHLFLIISLTSGVFSFGQSNVFIHFTPKIGGQTVGVNDLGSTVYSHLNGTSFQVDDVTYYVSKLKLTHDGGQEINFDTPDDVKLVKVNSTIFSLGSQNITNLEQVDFGVGVPQEWNHLDINSYPVGHPLGNQTNPVMQWGWTAGYFHYAFSGMGDNNGDNICDQQYETHCLGDANYKNVSLPMSGVVVGNEYHIYIWCNIDEWMFGADPATTGSQHTDGGIAITVMNNVESRNVFQADASASLNEVHEVGNVYFNNSDAALSVFWKEMNGMAEYQMVDMNGRVISEGVNATPNGQITLNNVNKGAYIFNCYNGEGMRIHSTTVMH